MFPGFLGIGAQKAGTTWLHAMLSMHEGIWLPHLKELHYFDRRFPIQQADTIPVARSRDGVLANHVAARLRRINVAKLKERLSIRRWGDLRWEFRYLFGEWDDEWYGSLFENARGRMAGDITPAYSCLSEAAISHAHKLMPDAKLILILRDPIERAWSHARMDFVHAAGRRSESIADTEYMAHFNGSASRLRGNYLGTIRRWLAHFPERQLFLGFYDEILSSPEDLLMRVFRFLGVSATERHIPSAIRTRFNAGTQALIPKPILHQYLAALYIEDLRELASQYGTYPQRWLEKCELALNRAPTAQ